MLRRTPGQTRRNSSSNNNKTNPVVHCRQLACHHHHHHHHHYAHQTLKQTTTQEPNQTPMPSLSTPPILSNTNSVFKAHTNTSCLLFLGLKGKQTPPAIRSLQGSVSSFPRLDTRSKNIAFAGGATVSQPFFWFCFFLLVCYFFYSDDVATAADAASRSSGR